MRLTHEWSLDDIKARASHGIMNHDARLVYAVHSPWWNICPPWYQEQGGIPCDPRGSVLLETEDFLDFIAAAEANPSHYGRHGIDAFVAAFHGNVVTDDGRPTSLDGWEAYNAMLDKEVKET